MTASARRHTSFPAVQAGLRAAALKPGGRQLKLSNVQVALLQTASTAALDIPVTTLTGNILVRIGCADLSPGVESPYTLVYDLAGANLPLTIRKALYGTDGGGEGSTHPRLVIATIKGAPVTGSAKLIRLTTTAAGLLGNWIIVTADLPAWWSGAVGAADGVGAFVVKTSHSTPVITTLGKNSLLVGCGNQYDATVGALTISGQGGAWKPDVAQQRTGTLAVHWQAVFVSKLSGVPGQLADLTLATSGATSPSWAAGLVEIRT